MLRSLTTPGRPAAMPASAAKKRKSSEGAENKSPNNVEKAGGAVEDSATKKSRFNLFRSPVIQRMLDPSRQKVPDQVEVPTKERKSGLPRFVATEAKKTRSSGANASASSSAAIQSSSSHRNPSPLPVSSPQYLDSSVVRSPMSAKLGKPTPRSSIGRSGRPSIGVKGRLRSGRPSIGGKIKNYFEQSSSAINEDKLNEILSTKAKTKKWDYKEKTKKQESTIAELKTALKTMIDEHKALKEKCIGAEMSISESFKDVDQQRQDLLQDVDSLRANEAKYRKEYYQASAALSVSATAQQHLQAEADSLRQRVAALEGSETSLLGKVTAEESQRQRAEQELARVTSELALTKQWLQESSAAFNTQIEQVRVYVHVVYALDFEYLVVKI